MAAVAYLQFSQFARSCRLCNAAEPALSAIYWSLLFCSCIPVVLRCTRSCRFCTATELANPVTLQPVTTTCDYNLCILQCALYSLQ